MLHNDVDKSYVIPVINTCHLLQFLSMGAVLQKLGCAMELVYALFRVLQSVSTLISLIVKRYCVLLLKIMHVNFKFLRAEP